MFPYPCSECTLFRCDLVGDICAECLANMPNFGIKARSFDDVSITLTVGGNPWTPAGVQVNPTVQPKVFLYGAAGAMPTQPIVVPRSSVPSPHIGGVGALIPGDNQHNAACAAAFLMSIPWSALQAWGVANGHPAISMPHVHALLEAYAKAP